jgi:hypothetical protein
LSYPDLFGHREEEMSTPEITIAVIVIVLLGGALAIWSRRRQKP